MAEREKWRWSVRVEPDEAAIATGRIFGTEPEVYRTGTSTLETFDDVVAGLKQHIPDLISIEYVTPIDYAPDPESPDAIDLVDRRLDEILESPAKWALTPDALESTLFVLLDLRDRFASKPIGSAYESYSRLCRERRCPRRDKSWLDFKDDDLDFWAEWVRRVRQIESVPHEASPES